MYAKVNNTTLIKFPYRFGDLQSENPSTNYGDNFDVSYWYPMTRDAIQNGYTLAPVTIAAEPTYDPVTETLVQNATPTRINGTWTLGWTVTALPAPTKTELKTYAADKRRAMANGAASINTGVKTIPMWVDPESRGSITGLVVASNIIPTLTTNWKGADEVFYELSTAEISAAAIGMMQYVQEVFIAEATIGAYIDADALTTYAEVDAFASWPTPYVPA